MKENQERVASSSKQSPIHPNVVKSFKAKLSTMSSKAIGSSSISVPSSHWNLENIFRQGKNFKNIHRISAKLSQEAVISVIKKHDESREPFIIEEFHELETWLCKVFNIKWLLEHYDKQSTHLPYTYPLKLLTLTRVLCS